MYLSHVVSSLACFSTPHMPSSGSFCSGYHNTIEWSIIPWVDSRLCTCTHSTKKKFSEFSGSFIHC